MTINEVLTIAAIFLGPIIAVRLTRYLDNRKEMRERKLLIFKTLMTTRAVTLSPAHVEALNRIDLEFSNKDKCEKAVIEAWKAYLDLLGDKSLTPENWEIKRVDLLVELLHKMASVLDYEFDKTHIKNSTYLPVGHGKFEEEITAIRKGLVDLLEGKRVLPVYFHNKV